MQARNKILKALEIGPLAIRKKLVAFIKQKVNDAGADGAVIGLSGGVDSSTVAFLCAEALGGDKVLGVSMPEMGVTNAADAADAKEVATKLGMDCRVVDITPAIQALHKNITGFEAGALLPAANLKPRVRMAILYYYANLLNRLVVGAGNRSEIRAGYFTKYGDGAADLLPLGYIYKTQVKQLAAHLGVPKRIIEKVPSAGLWKGQTDEGELGVLYEKLDMIYAGLDLKLKPDVIAKAAGVEVEKVKHFVERERRTAHKLRVPEVPKF